MQYDSRYRMTNNELTKDGIPLPAGRMAGYGYLHDDSGNITAIQDVVDHTYDRHFVYDDLNRLITTTSGSSLWMRGDYAWDAMGNIARAKLTEVVDGGPETMLRSNPKKFKPTDKPKKKRESSQSTVQPLGRDMAFFYRDATPVLQAVSLNGLSRPVNHDAAGNQTSYVVQRRYSARNLFAEVQDETEPGSPVHKIAYSYDGLGLRVVRAESPSDGPDTTARRFYVYTPELQLLAATRDDGPNVWGGNPPSAFANNVDYEIVWFAGRPVAQIAPGGSRMYTFTDHLGTPILQTDHAKVIRWRVEHEPFGNVYEVREGTRTDQPLRFPGQDLAMTWEGPEESYNIFRWYNSSWGRYTQADPIGVTGTDINLFRYAMSNPIKFADRLGLDVRICCRPVDIPGFRDRDHCFIESNTGGRRRTWGLHAWRSNDGRTYGVYRMNDPTDTGGICSNWSPSPCGANDDCITREAANYPLEDYGETAGVTHCNMERGIATLSLDASA